VVEETIGRGHDQPSGGNIPFTPRAKTVLELSHQESKQLGQGYIGTEHILLPWSARAKVWRRSP
jgi:hypothetical protein